MAWLRCPHCATFLPKAHPSAEEGCGCPVCGGVFVVAPVAPEARSESATKGLDAFYPPSPRDVPADLAQPGSRYRRSVVLLLATLIVFFLVYLLLLIGSGCLIFWSLRWFGLLPGLPVSFLALIVFLYLLKGFFKSERKSKSWQVEITAAEQPRLFAFLYRLCAELGAPAPYRVFLTPEVNAAAFHEQSLLGLLHPTPKSLILGLGLVNVLALSEFKAVLAHEFGHFAQGSMQLGVYVYAIERLLRGLVAGRDWFDEVVLRLRAQAGILGLLGGICWGVISGLQRVLIGLFYAINFLDKSLSRQMEFHADLMAVSACGSEAIVRVLARSEFADEALNAAAGDLKLAADHDRYSRDLFLHQRDAMEHLRQQRQDPHLGEPPPLTEDPLLSPEVFDPEDGPPPMWADHPSNYDREQNAKRRYVRCPLDDRPAWLLFDDAAEARERVTWRFYRLVLKIRRDAVLEDPEAIRAFLHEERRALTYDPRYHGMYDARFIEPGELNEVIALGAFNEPELAALRKRYAALYGETVAKRSAVYQRHREERERILAYRRDNPKDRKEPLEFRGRRYRRGDIPNLLKFIGEQLEKDCRLLAEEDREVFLVHYHMSQQLGSAALPALKQRYLFHLALQRLLADLLYEQGELESALAFLAEEREGTLPAELFNELYRLLRRVRDTLRTRLEEADELVLPPLPHLKSGARLGPLLWDKPLVGRLGDSGRSISSRKLQKLHGQLAEVIERARHLHFKSLGGILALQEEIARRWLQCQEQGQRNSIAPSSTRPPFRE